MTLYYTQFVSILLFLLTRPLRDVTYNHYTLVFLFYISTHTPLAGRDKTVYRNAIDDEISTHTPLAGRDEYPQQNLYG